MATRLYDHENVAAPISPAVDAGWESSAAPFARKSMLPTLDAADALTTVAGFTSTTGQDRCHRQLISPPMAAGVVFTIAVSTFKCYAQCLESAANDNIISRLGVRILSRDGSTVRATLLTIADYSTAAEWGTALRNKIFANGDVSLASYTTVAGDRLVVEPGHNDIAGSSISGSSRWGSGGSADLGENETSTSTTERPWFETSVNLAFESRYADAVLEDSPYLYWRLGDGSGTVAEDASANNRDGTYSGPTLRAIGGLYGDPDPCADFDAVDDYVQSNVTLNSSPITVEVWYDYSGTPPGAPAYIAGFMDGLGGSAFDKDLYLDTAGKVTWYVYDGGQKLCVAPSALSAGWHHLVGTNDGTTSRLYIDGLEVATLAAAGTYTGYAANNILVGGNLPDVATAWLAGKRDEFAVWASALSAARIHAHYLAAVQDRQTRRTMHQQRQRRV